MKKEKIIYFSDELNDDFASTNIKQIELGEKFKYMHKNVFFRIFEFIIYYLFAAPIVWFIQKFITRQKIVNKKILKKYRNKGYFIYSNHTQLMSDAFSGPLMTFPKKCFVIVNPDATSIKGIRLIVQMLGAIPLPKTVKEHRAFMNCIEIRIKQKSAIMIYPEAHIWPYYTKIRPFKSTSFKYPIKYNTPVFVMTHCYQKSRFFKRPKIISIIDGPFFPNNEININEASVKL